MPDRLKVIDFRFRPPYKSFATTDFYTNVKKDTIWGYEPSEAVIKKDMELAVKEMDESDVDIGVVIARESKWGGIAKNSDLPELLKEYPGRFIGVPHIQYEPEKDLTEDIQKYVVEGACTAVYIEPGFRLEKYQLHASDEKWYPMYEYCQEHSIPVLIQYGGGVNTVEFYTPSDIYHIADDFPKLKIAITHGGWPQVMPMIQQAYAHTNVYLAPDIYFSGFPGSQDYITAANTILRKKILFGSCYPNMALKDAIKKYTEVGVRKEILPDILYNNAAEFFNLQ